MPHTAERAEHVDNTPPARLSDLVADICVNFAEDEPVHTFGSGLARNLAAELDAEVSADVNADVAADLDDDVSVDQDVDHEREYEESAERRALRKLKGKAKADDTGGVHNQGGVHKRIRFTQGITIESNVNETQIDNDEPYLPTLPEDESQLLDENGDLAAKQAEEEHMMLLADENFEDNELEAEVRGERGMGKVGNLLE